MDEIRGSGHRNHGPVHLALAQPGNHRKGAYCLARSGNLANTGSTNFACLHPDRTGLDHPVRAFRKRKTWLDLPQANDASVAFVAVIFLFCLPSGEKKGDRLLDWKTANKIPWGMLVLVGAGLCLGEGFKQSGLSATIAGVFSGIENLPLLIILLGIALLVTFLTEMTSNTATTNVLMPILGAAATASDIDPILLMIPAAMSASCAFMLPVATIPNAVVFGTGEVSVRRMAREGLALNLIGAMVVSGICYLLLS